MALMRTLVSVVKREPKEVREAREATRRAACASCPFNQPGHVTGMPICTLCGCFIDGKVLIPAESCPHKPPNW